MNIGIELAETGWLPDWIVRRGIRRLLARRLKEADCGECETNQAALQAFAQELRTGPLAIEQPAANRQHYEVPSAFFERVLGPQLKYSCCYWPPGVDTLEAAEEAMLKLTAERAGITDHMRVLDLGCGWGSLSLWLAARYRHAQVTAVSNSRTQGEFIRARARSQGLTNLEVRTCDVSDLDLSKRFDRVVSVEMFEHFRNYEQLLAKIARWLSPDGKLLVHIFCHRELAYPFADHGNDDWMARHFFTGGIMPSDSLLLGFQRDLVVSGHWRFSGEHYQQTLEAWLARLDRHYGTLNQLFSREYGDEAVRILGRWRIFLMACAELFGYRQGQEWWISHYLFEPRPLDPSSHHSVQTRVGALPLGYT